MKLRNLKAYNPVRMARKLIITVIAVLLPSLIYPQSTQSLDIYRYMDVNAPVADTGFLGDIIKYINDTLFGGGGVISNIEYIGSPKGVGLFRQGVDVGISDGLILSNGYVKTTTTVDNGFNKTGAQAIPSHDSLGPYGTGGMGGGLKDSDMDYMVGIIVGDMKPDTAVDPSVITFKFKPYYNSIHLKYVFASEEYLWQYDPNEPPPPPVLDIDFTDSTASDFMAILVKKSPSNMGPDNIASVRVVNNPPPNNYIPISVKYLNHTFPYPGNYNPNYNPDKSFIFDGYTIPYDIRPFSFSGEEILPCRNYWIKIAVADFPNGVVAGGYNLSHQMNSVVFLKAYSLMSGYGLAWTVEGAMDNPEFAGDSSLVEGGCSNMEITVKFNVMPQDTSFIRIRIDNAVLSEYIIEPPLIQDSLIMIPDSVMEYKFKIYAVDDNMNEGTNGIEKWFIRYQMDPCDVPIADTGGWGTGNMGYSGLIKAQTRDYNPYANATKTYGPLPSSIYFCGNDVTVSITDIVQGGIPPYNYLWSHPVVGQFDIGEQFTTPISANPDYVYCTISDRCTGKPGYIAGKDTVVIYSLLEVQASSDFQLCQGGDADIQVQSTNVGNDYTTIWYFQGNPVGYNSVYTVTWAEYGIYAPTSIVFTCVVTDFCGNTASDDVLATFYAVVEITGVPLICLGDTIQLTCSGALSYEWHYGSLGGPVLGSSQTLNYTPTSAGFHTICVSIINDCNIAVDTCFTFEVSQLICAVKLDNANDFNVCPNVDFSLQELNAYDGWEWEWFDDGTDHTALGQSITLALKDAGVHQVSITAYNINGCYHTLTFPVTVFNYAEPLAFSELQSVCIDYSTHLSASTNAPGINIVNYFWTANPPDASLAGQEILASPEVTPQITTTYQCRITDNNGCLDSATVEVDVRPQIAGNIFSNPDSNCTEVPVQLNFQPIIEPLPEATYFWTLDGGIPPTSTAPQPTVIWNTLGLKNIQLTISEPGCEKTFFFQFNVHPDPLLEITGIPLICLGETIQLLCSGAQSYQWYNGSIAPGNEIGGDSQVLNFTPATAGFHTVWVSVINDCGKQDDTSFTFEVSQLICAVELDNANDFRVCPNVDFSLQELNAFDGWIWNWSDDGINHSASGQTITLSLKDAGVHQVSVTAFNSYSCSNTLTFPVTVYPYSGIQAFTELSSVCVDYQTQLSATSGPVSIVNYFWTATPNDLSLNGQQTSSSPVVTPQETTTYQCRITDNNGCLDSMTVVVNVRPPIAGSIVANPGSSCTDKSVSIDFQPVIQPLPEANYYWTLADGTPSSSSLTQPNVIWSTPGQKNIQLTITEPGCEETFFLQFTVHPDPLAVFTASNSFGCQPVNVSFSNGSSNLENPTYLWEFGDGNTDTQANPSHIFENPGKYDVTLTITNSTGCVNTLTVNNLVEVFEVPVADFSADPQAATIDNPTIRFTDLVNIPYKLIEWDFGDGATDSVPSPRHTYGAPGNYMVVMYTETGNGCWDRDTLEIGIVEDIKVFVPNAFSPNGDGINDCFSVGGTTGDVIDVFRIIIYSRWGQLVYESQISSPECVWDGKDMDGNIVTSDTYVFRIFGTNFRGAKKVFEGIVMVVK